MSGTGTSTVGSDIETKSQTQMKYIFERLKSLPLASDHPFNNLVLKSPHVRREDGLYYLSVPLQNWVKVESIPVKSSESKVYTCHIGDFEYIIKSPKKHADYEDLIREFFVGLRVNALRPSVPNFMCTHGAFICPEIEDKGKVQKSSRSVRSVKSTAFVIYEKIPGNSLEYMLKNNKLSFDQYIQIYFQILIALEIAQRNIRFCHFDLHTGNVILRPISKPYTYTVVLDNVRYDITAKDYIPVLIDFGMSSVTENDYTVGSYRYEKHGIMNYAIQGSDMYKLLYYSTLHSFPELSTSIQGLFSFYGENDPYSIVKQKPDFIKKISYEYVKRIAFSRVATCTPLDFMKWISTHFTLGFVTTCERNIYIPFYGLGKTCKSYITTEPASYVLLEYMKRICKFKFKKVNTKKLIRYDKIMLSEYKNIKLPNDIKLRDYVNRIMQIRLDSKKDASHVCEAMISKTNSYRKIFPYLQYVYTIRELGLEKRYKTYRSFIDSFLTSPQYRFYVELNDSIERTVRWATTLLEANNVPKIEGKK